jgi:hypothetical protein
MMDKKLEVQEALLKRNGYRRGKNRSFGKTVPKDVQEFKRHVVALTPADIEFLVGMEGFHFSWDWYDPTWEGLNASGRIRYPGIAGLLRGDTETSMPAIFAGFENHLWTAQCKVGWDERLDHAILIDDLGLGNAVLLDLATGRLALWIFNRGTFTLTLGIQQYFEQAFRFHGLHLWQRHFLQNLNEFPSELVHNHSLLIDKLFPELSEFTILTEIPSYLEIAQRKKYYARFVATEPTLLDLSIEYDDCCAERGLTLPSLNKLILEFGISLSPEMLAWFTSIGTLSFVNWKHRLNNGKQVSINYFLYGMQDMFTGFRTAKGTSLTWNYNTFQLCNFGIDEENDPEYQPLKEMWTFYWEEGCQVALRRATETGKLEMVWSWDIPDFIPLQVDFETFIEAFLACGGLQSWVFHLEKESPPYKLVPFEEPLKEIFPNVDTKLFHFHS